MQIEKKLQAMNIQLPPTPEPAASYIPATLSDNLVFVSGQTPKNGSELLYKGKIGADLTVQDGYKAAQVCVLRCLSALKSVAGDLDNVEQIVKLTGFVNSADNFFDQPKVVNGASDLLMEIFGEKGKHARSALGVHSLPGNAAVEIELIARIRRN